MLSWPCFCEWHTTVSDWDHPEPVPGLFFTQQVPRSLTEPVCCPFHIFTLHCFKQPKSWSYEMKSELVAPNTFWWNPLDKLCVLPVSCCSACPYFLWGILLHVDRDLRSTQRLFTQTRKSSEIRFSMANTHARVSSPDLPCMPQKQLDNGCEETESNFKSCPIPLIYSRPVLFPDSAGLVL